MVMKIGHLKKEIRSNWKVS